MPASGDVEHGAARFSRYRQNGASMGWITWIIFAIPATLGFIFGRISRDRDRPASEVPAERDHTLIVQLQREKNNALRERDVAIKERDEAKMVAEETRQEKDILLNRLSQLAGTKLRDNNPNITDLSDMNRPGKLAEQFSELYDNEWTDAYTIIEEKLCSERRTIVVLLDIVMETFNFSIRKLGENWQLVSKWYLNEDLPDNDMVRKSMKDVRKVNIKRLLPDFIKEFTSLLNNACIDSTMSALLESDELQRYIRQCLKVCFYMSATDPPVVIVAPGWYGTSNVLSITDEIENEHLALNSTSLASIAITADGRPNNQNLTEFNSRNVEDAIDTISSKSNDKLAIYDETKDKPLVTTTRSKPKGKRYCTRDKLHELHKEQFLEYTNRGKFMQYVVWPRMLLHEGGPSLKKGVAQGTDEVEDDKDLENWSWYICDDLY